MILELPLEQWVALLVGSPLVAAIFASPRWSKQWKIIASGVITTLLVMGNYIRTDFPDTWEIIAAQVTLFLTLVPQIYKYYNAITESLISRELNGILGVGRQTKDELNAPKIELGPPPSSFPSALNEALTHLPRPIDENYLGQALAQMTFGKPLDHS